MAEMSLAEGIDRLQRRAKIVKALLIAGFLLIAAVLVGQIGELQGMISLAEDVALTPAASLYAIATLGDALLTIGTIILFGMWIYRAAANIVAAEVPGFDYTAGWAVGWYFIPFANLVKPFTAMRQIWNASHGGGGDQLDTGNGLLTLWWTTWLTSNIATNVSFRISMSATSPDTVRLGLQFGIVGSLIALVLYPVAIKLVDGITTAQRDRLTAAAIFA
jgi:hypothetical protein